MPLNLNGKGLVVCVAAFGAALGVAHLAGWEGEGPPTLIAGALCVVLDAAARAGPPGSSGPPGSPGSSARAGPRWLDPTAGGTFLGIPLWLVGLLWVVLGVAYTLFP